jgi:lipopolysaccharide/colanic/teichoic acid biosynthesis glycosyltransferase
MRTLLDMRIVGAPVEEATDVFEAVFGRVSATAVCPEDILLKPSFQPAGGATQFQTAYSLLSAVLILALASPLMLLVALLVRISFPGSVLVRTQCAGLNGKPFTLLRFRSRHDYREAIHPDMAEHAGVAPLGQLLGRTGLDVLPALVNVLRGEMSFVGPRPEQVEYVDELTKLIPYYSQRNVVKPGLIGWAQLNVRRRDSPESAIRKLEYDLYYIKNVSAWLDFYIGLNTFRNLLMGWPS